MELLAPMDAEILGRVFAALAEHRVRCMKAESTREKDRWDVLRLRTLEEAHLDRRPASPEAALGTALFLLTLSEAARRGIRTTQRGIHCYPTIEAAEADRVRFASEQLRRADSP